MTSRKLLEELNKQRDAINAAISVIEHMLGSESHTKKRAAILKTIKKNKRMKTRFKSRKALLAHMKMMREAAARKRKQRKVA